MIFPKYDAAKKPPLPAIFYQRRICRRRGDAEDGIKVGQGATDPCNTVPWAAQHQHNPGHGEPAKHQQHNQGPGHGEPEKETSHCSR